jgi:hypothetical protein
VANGRVDIMPLPFRLLASDDQVDVGAATQTMIRDRQEAVRGAPVRVHLLEKIR